jgi:hypothetical protein
MLKLSQYQLRINLNSERRDIVQRLQFASKFEIPTTLSRMAYFPSLVKGLAHIMKPVASLVVEVSRS